MKALKVLDYSSWIFICLRLSLFLCLWSSCLEKQAEKNTSAWIRSPATRVCGSCAYASVFTHLLGTVCTLSGCGELIWLDARCTSKPLVVLRKQRRESGTKGSWVGIRAGKDHSSIAVMGKKDSLGKLVEFITSWNQTSIMRSKANLNNTNTFTSPKLYSWFSTFSNSMVHGDRE